LSTDGWTDGHGETSIALYNFVAGGINITDLYNQHVNTTINKKK